MRGAEGVGEWGEGVRRYLHNQCVVHREECANSRHTHTSAASKRDARRATWASAAAALWACSVTLAVSVASWAVKEATSACRSAWALASPAVRARCSSDRASDTLSSLATRLDSLVTDAVRAAAS